ncbi:hypothetical protein B566_EDAN001079 [Ephemera danica]|nr:hypothetical protein B566_EDAN001079 [Ephemera danica]
MLCACRVPEKPKEDKGYVYQAGPVRKKDDRQKLPGWECHECKIFFETYCKNMNTQERQQVVGHCSRHRQALPFISNTPPGIWEIGEIQSPVGVTQNGKLFHEPKNSKTWLIDNAVPMPPSLEPNM